MDLMQMQQRAINIQPTAAVAVDPPAGKSAISDSSANSFSDALESALGLDEDIESTTGKICR